MKVSLYKKRPGNDLLSRLLSSTIGAVKLNYSVRNEKRWILHAIVTGKSDGAKAPKGFDMMK